MGLISKLRLFGAACSDANMNELHLERKFWFIHHVLYIYYKNRMNPCMHVKKNAYIVSPDSVFKVRSRKCKREIYQRSGFPSCVQWKSRDLD